MALRADAIQRRITGLLELMAAARKSLDDLDESPRQFVEARRTNLQATIETVQSELARAEKELGLAVGLDPAEEILTDVKMRTREGRQTTNWAKLHAQAQRGMEHAMAQQPGEPILASASRGASERKARAKDKK